MATSNSYSDNLVSKQDGVTLRDYNHAAKLYSSNNLKFSPKVKFLYHCYFSIDPSVGSILSTLTQKYGLEIGLLVKNADLPKFQSTVETKNKYNRKKNVQTSISYQPINITFHDDNHGLTTALLEAYYRWYYADGWHGSDPGAYNKAGDGDNTYKSRERNQYRYGLDNNLSVPFFRNIQISQLARSQYTTFTIVNPIITSWEHDSVEGEGNSFMQNTISIQYEAVHYSRGTVEAGDAGNPVGYGMNYYDMRPSPIAPTDAEPLPATDLNIKTYNKFQTEYNNGTSTYPSSVSNSSFSLRNLTTVQNNIGGLVNIEIPKSRGVGGSQSVSSTTASTVTTRNLQQSLSSSSREELLNNPAKLESLAIQLFKNSYLQNGGSGVNGLISAWDNLPTTEQESFRKQILEGAV